MTTPTPQTRARVALVVLAVTAATACRRPATAVVVAIDSDAPAHRTLTIRASVRRADAPADAPSEMHTWTREPGGAGLALPASFSVTPGATLARDARVIVRLDAELAAGDASEPALVFARTMRFALLAGQTTRVPIFLPVSCGERAVGCVSTAPEACTASALCEERGQTCGDDGACVAPDVVPLPVPPGADVTVVPRDASDGGDDPPPPRLIAPLSTSLVTRRPVLRWQRPSITNADGARIELCRERSCATVAQVIDVPPGAALTARPVLARGVWFWRARGLRGTRAGAATSATWQFTAGARDITREVPAAGTTLDVNGDGYADLLVGAPGARGGAGVVHLYLGGPLATLRTTPARDLTGPAGAMVEFGTSVASAGDVNGDGYGDAIVGAIRAMGGGRAYVYHGSASGLAATPAAELAPSTDATALVGRSVAGAGDLDGDGYGDVIVGAPGHAAETGATYVHHGGAAGVSSRPTLTLNGEPGAASFFGVSVAGPGDVDGDGTLDLAVGARQFNMSTGRAYLFRGTANSDGTAARIWARDGFDGADGSFGTWVARAGDINGDGYADVSISADPAVMRMGRAYLFLGAVGGLPATPGAALSAPMTEFFGYPATSAGDIDGDGFGELAVGEVTGLEVTGRRGYAYVYPGTAAGLATTPLRLDGLDGRFSLFGWAIAHGDIDRDGFGDLAVTAYRAAGNTGVVYVFRGSAMGLVTAPAARIASPDGVDSRFGWSVACEL